MQFAKSTLPTVVTIVTGLLVLLGQFIPELSPAAKQIIDWQVTVAGIALGLGAANLIRIHMRNIQLRRGTTWPLSVATLVSLVVFATIGIAFGSNNPTWVWIFNNVHQPMHTTMASLLAFWVCSASYRAFRLRNFHSGIFLVTGLIVILGQVGIGQVALPGIQNVSSWFLSVPASASLRGLGIVMGLGVCAVTMRVLLGLERGATGGGQ